MTERLEKMGKRAELRQERTRLETECDALRSSLRRLLPAEEDAGDLNEEKILNTAISLNQSLAELKAIDKKLNVLNDILGDS